MSILGYGFEAPQPYVDGSIIGLGEALVLNAALAENLRNNFSKRLKAKIDTAKSQGREALNATELAYLKTEFADYAKGYKFPTLRTSRVSADPIDRAAHAIASDIVRTKLNAQGRRLEDLEEQDAERYIARIMALPQVRSEAQKRASATQQVIIDALEL